MATRSLGALTLDLIARIGGFAQGMTEAERVADRKSREIAAKQKARAKEVERAWSVATKFIAGAFAGLSIAGLFRTFTRESIEAQNEQAQLAAVLKSTGEAAGFSAVQLNKMAASMAGRSTFSEGDINRAQTRLLSYTGIVGKQFPEAMRAVIDMAARMGMSVEQSAETIGRALDIPSQGLTALQRQGFRFTETQKAAVEELERTGRVAEAQAIVLDALKSSYGGAAQAARDTFGGSIAALQNQLRSLMIGGDGSLDGTKDAINSLTATLGSDEVKQAFASLTEGLASIVKWTIVAIAELFSFSRSLGEFLGRFTHGAADPIERIDEHIRSLQGNIKLLNDGLARSRPGAGGYDEMQREVAALTHELEQAQRARAGLLLGTTTGATAAPTPAGVCPPSQAEMDALTAAAARREEQQKAAKAAAQAAQAYLEQLQAQLRGTQDLTVAETVLADKRYQAAGKAVQAALMSVAKQIDSQRALKEAAEEANRVLTDRNALVQSNAEAARQLAISVETPFEALNRELRELEELARTNPFITGEMLTRLDAAAWKRFIDSTKEATAVVDDFGRRFAENTQDILGNGLYEAMSGNFRNIAKSFGEMLLRMVAQAQAADLARAIFGTDSKGNLGGGWVNSLGSWFASFFSTPSAGSVAGSAMVSSGAGGLIPALATGTNYVPRDNFLALLHKGEAVVPKPYNPIAGGIETGAAGMRVEVNNYGNDEVRARQGPDGRAIIDIVRRESVRAVAADTSSGGSTARATAGRFGVNNGATLSRRRG